MCSELKAKCLAIISIATENKVSLLDSYLQNPDCSHIENLWAELKSLVLARETNLRKLQQLGLS